VPTAAGRRGEPLPFAGVGIDAFVVDSRRGDLDGAGAGEHLAWLMAAVAYDQPVAVGVALIGELVDVAIHLGLQRFGQHPPGTLAHDLIDQRRTTGRTVIASGRVRDYGEHGRTFPSRRANADPDQNLHGLRSC
jgi:hypothetical protein